MMVNFLQTSLPAAGSTNWYGHYSAMDESMRAILNSYGVALDTFDGATDDDKLTAAMSYSAALTVPVPIRLGARIYTFNTARTLYDGFALIGVEGINNAELGSTKGAFKTRVLNKGGNTWMSASGGGRSGSQNWDVTIRNIAFEGNSSTQWMGGAAVIWCMWLSNLSFSGYKSILGSQATKLLINLCQFDGWLSFHNSYNGAIHIGGSDNALFLNETNIDSGTAFAPSGTNQYHLWLDSMEKTTLGPLYTTGEGAWGCIRVTGNANPANANGSSNLGGPLWIYGAKIEGRNAGAPCNGNLIRVEGGQLQLSQLWLGYAMANPSATGRTGTGNADEAVVHHTGGVLMLTDVCYDKATAASLDVPLVKSFNGAESHVKGITRGSKGGNWGTSRPRVSGVTYADTTVQSI